MKLYLRRNRNSGWFRCSAEGERKGMAYHFRITVYALCLCMVLGLVFGSLTVNAATSSDIPKTQFNYGLRSGSTVVLKWNAVPGAEGYQIRMSSDKKFSEFKNRPIRYGDKLSTTITNVTEKGSIYYKIRSYRLGPDGKKIYSKWSGKLCIAGVDSSYEFAGNSKINSGFATIYYAVGPGRKKKTVCVNAGHGTKGGESASTLCHPDGSAKVTGGTTASGSTYATAVSAGTTLNDGSSEASVNLKLALTVKDKLLEKGYNVLMIRQTDDVQLDNIARTVLANNLADCHIALHYDSTTSDKGAFYISVPDVSSYRAMYPVSSHYKDHEKLGKSLVDGLKGAGVKIYGSGSMGIDLTQTSYSTVPSVDLEVGDKASDHSAFAHEKIADGIVAGVETFFGK
ncbi:MAG: N-acetylmuramoyl-L-alanine amidase [Lachnospiraceae bacterium]|nr:N-acetylmuramoyl-L-alanine amidase [Lachnospiraceae bacterium]